jgi:hypothetical protein
LLLWRGRLGLAHPEFDGRRLLCCSLLGSAGIDLVALNLLVYLRPKKQEVDFNVSTGENGDRPRGSSLLLSSPLTLPSCTWSLRSAAV